MLLDVAWILLDGAGCCWMLWPVRCSLMTLGAAGCKMILDDGL